MKILYNTLALLVGLIIVVILFPILAFMVQLTISLLFILAELLLFPICIYIIYVSWKIAKKSNKETENK